MNSDFVLLLDFVALVFLRSGMAPSSSQVQVQVQAPVASKPLPLYATFLSSATAACWAETLSLPVDTAKVRLQLQGAAAASASSATGGSTSQLKYNGLLGTMRTVAREEGVAALWKGLTPGLHRQCLFGGLRIGMYEPVKNLFVGRDHEGPVPLVSKILAGLTTGTCKTVE